MKSFADWTDEIRALMNPPAPMADTCNFQRLREEGIKAARSMIDAEQYRKELLGEFKLDNAFYDADTVKWDPAEPGADTTGTSLAFRSGRQCGKSVMQGEWFKRAMEFLASQDYGALEQRVVQNGQALWGFNPTGEPTIVIYDEYTIFDPENLI